MELKDYLVDEGAISRFAREVGLSRQAVYNYLNYVSVPSLRKVIEIESKTDGQVTYADWKRSIDKRDRIKNLV